MEQESHLLESCTVASIIDAFDGFDDGELWVFGYGSILWKTGFQYNSKQVGYIDGYVRRFWQGSIIHRGTPQSPGRVATLVPCKEGRVWGVAYQLKGSEMISKALDHLALRECHNGGYVARMLSFNAVSDTSRLPSQSVQSHSVCGSCKSFDDGKRKVLAFTASVGSSLYLGPADDDHLVNDVVSTFGSSGHNVEYVIRLAKFVRDNLPQDKDEHLFELERKVRAKVNERGLSVEKLISSHEHLSAPLQYSRGDAVQG